MLLLALLIPCQSRVCPSVVPCSLLGVLLAQEGLGQVSSAAHRAESHTTPSPKVSRFSSKHTHASPSRASSRISSFSRCSSKVSKGLVCVQATQHDHFKPMAPHSFSNKVRHKYLLTHSHITNICVYFKLMTIVVMYLLSFSKYATFYWSLHNIYFCHAKMCVCVYTVYGSKMT